MKKLCFSANDPAIRSVVGEKKGDLIRLRSSAGCGLFGPYVDLPAGECTARIKFAGRSEGWVTVEISAEAGKLVLSSRVVDLSSLRNQAAELSAVLPKPMSHCEVRLFCEPNVNADISGVEIEVESRAANPYATQPEFAFWRRAVAEVPAFALDPLTSVPFKISSEDKIATAGSCFAQEIARNLSGRGWHYFVPERAPVGMTPEQAAAHNFGTFSARYGNIYTARQLLQLFQRAHGMFTPALSVWHGSGNRVVDPFRPRIQPGGYKNEDELLADRKRHLDIVLQMFRELDVFVFTLGLTEAWVNRRDGSVLPIAPGVAGGVWDPAEYEFKNFTVREVTQDLGQFMDLFRAVNPHAKVIFTVSPVPLVATYEDRHVLVSTVYSKSVLRVAAQEITDAWEGTSYFPSYEIIAWSRSDRSYFEADGRSVSRAGVQHVMRVFFKHYADGVLAVTEHMPSLKAEVHSLRQIVCDEEAIDA